MLPFLPGVRLREIETALAVVPLGFRGEAGQNDDLSATAKRPLLWLSCWLSSRPKMAGMDGNRTHPGRLNSAPQTVLKTAGGTSPHTSPALGMLFGQRDADALDPKVFRVAGQQSDEEPQHSVDLRAPRDGGHERRLWGAKGAQL